MVRLRLDTVTDYVRRVFSGLADDNAFFLAGGVAFSLLLALVPFVLLLVVGLSFVLGRSPEQATTTVVALTESFLPRDAFEAAAVLRTIVDDVLRTRGAVGVGAGLGFVWTATRLFGSLRAVLAIVLDRDERSIVAGKLFDLGAAFITTCFAVLWVVISTYLSIAGDRGTTFLADLGVRLDALGALSYWFGRALGFALLCVTFYGLYRGLPRRRPSREAVLIAALVAAVLFELARQLYTVFLVQLSPSTLYTGTIAVIVSVVFWVYYGALLFLLGAEVAQAHELRREELARLASVPDPSPAPRPRLAS